MAYAQNKKTTERAWCWLLSAFLSEGHHQQTIESWVCWIELLGRAAQQSLCHKSREAVPLWRDLKWTSIDGDYLKYRDRLGRYRQALGETFKAYYDSQSLRPIAESRAELIHGLSIWQDRLYGLVGAMFIDALVLLGEPSFPYCLGITGSLSRSAAVSYSDVEMMVWIGDASTTRVLDEIVSIGRDSKREVYFVAQALPSAVTKEGEKTQTLLQKACLKQAKMQGITNPAAVNALLLTPDGQSAYVCAS